MALTRRRLVQDSRQLRSGHLTVRQTANSSLKPCIFKPSLLSTQVSKRRTNTDGFSKSTHGAPQAGIFRHEAQGPALLTAAALEQEDPSHGIGEAEGEGRQDTHMLLGFPPPPAATRAPGTLHRSSEDPEASGPRAVIQPQGFQSDAINSNHAFVMSPEDVGLPTDGIWDHDAAYDRRFCYEHGEFEYLGTADRWMFPGDFDVRNAEAVLDTLHQQHQELHLKFDPHARRCQAECRGSLFSHVYRVLDKRRHGGKMLYLVQWKACWTPKSSIDDKDWLEASLEVKRDPRRRRSTRLANSPEEEMVKHEKIMMVVKLDNRGS